MVDSLDKYILCAENVLSHEECDRISNEYTLDSDWNKAGIGLDDKVDTEVRNLSMVNISKEDIISKNFTTRKQIDEVLFTAFSNAIRAYIEVFPECTIQADTGYDLLRYKTGEFYKEHVDSFATQLRSVSCSLALNDEYTGGEFAFFSNELKIRVNKGSAILFPSNFMYPHQILPVTSGVRYSVVTWFK